MLLMRLAAFRQCFLAMSSRICAVFFPKMPIDGVAKDVTGRRLSKIQLIVEINQERTLRSFSLIMSIA